MINKSAATVISIDIPSGLFGEDNSHAGKNNIIEADFTLSFQFPKLSFMFPENDKYAGEWTVLPVDLDFSAINTPFTLLEKKLITPLLKQRNKFDHKGIFGHGLLIGGSYGKMGAVILGAKAALRTGIGLITCHIPGSGNNILQVAVPEAMISQDIDETHISDIGNTDNYNAIGIGPGMGTEPVSQKAVHELLAKLKKPLVIDADALNILSLNKEWISVLPSGTIITPHPKEFERLAGKSANGYERLQKQMEFSRQHNLIVVLKGAYTSVSEPDGNVWFNSTGNAGMATAGSGDVLTGMILSLLAQGYNPVNAAITGVYLHGLAGDMAAERSGCESVIASDIISETGAAFKRLREI
jgi:NAD(P)H-hydrate epimerase